MPSNGCPLSLKGRRLVAVAVVGTALLAGIAYYYYSRKDQGESFDGPVVRPVALKKRKKKKKRTNAVLNASSSSSAASQNSDSLASFTGTASGSSALINPPGSEFREQPTPSPSARNVASSGQPKPL